jgi:hypothetical protein
MKGFPEKATWKRFPTTGHPGGPGGSRRPLCFLLYLATATATASAAVTTAAVRARLIKEAAGMAPGKVARVGCCMDMGAMNASAGRDGEIMHEWDLSSFGHVIGWRE